MNDTQKKLLLEASARLLWYSAQLETMDEKLDATVISLMRETGHFSLVKDGSIFNDDLKSLSGFQQEFFTLTLTAKKLAEIFERYGLEGFEDYATV